MKSFNGIKISKELDVQVKEFLNKYCDRSDIINVIKVGTNRVQIDDLTYKEGDYVICTVEGGMPRAFCEKYLSHFEKFGINWVEK